MGNNRKDFVVNDPAESSFGGATRQLQHFGHVGLTNAGGVDQVKRKGEMSNGFENKRKKGKRMQKLDYFTHCLIKWNYFFQ